MRFVLPIDLSNLSLDSNLIRFVSSAVDQIQTILNGQVGLTDNCKTSLLSVTFTKANTQLAIPHTLGILPTGFFTVGASVGGVVYNGTTSNTKQYLYLQSTIAGTYNLLIF